MVSHAYRETQRALEKVFEKQIFFVAGVMKSGTTWLQFLLDAHPEICCRGEGHFVDVLYPQLYNALSEYNSRVKVRKRSLARGGIKSQSLYFKSNHRLYLLATVIGLILARGAEGAGLKCIGDKTPLNINSLNFLDTMFPTAKYFHIIRDGRDAAAATWTREIQIDREGILQKFENLNVFAEYFAKMWTERIKRGQDFGTANPNRYFEFRYEDLHREPEPIVRAMFEFLGVDAGDQVVSECIDAGSFERLTGGRKRGEEKPGAHMRKGVVGDWRNHFDEADQSTFHEHAGTLLKELGYDD